MIRPAVGDAGRAGIRRSPGGGNGDVRQARKTVSVLPDRHAMKILWIDPLNTNPQFLNLMTVVLQEAGHEVHVCSTVRDGHPPPPGIHWTPFLRRGSHPPSLKRDARTTLRTLVSYPFAWSRAIRRAGSSGVKSLLVTD